MDTAVSNPPQTLPLVRTQGRLPRRGLPAGVALPDPSRSEPDRRHRRRRQRGHAAGTARPNGLALRHGTLCVTLQTALRSRACRDTATCTGTCTESEAYTPIVARLVHRLTSVVAGAQIVARSEPSTSLSECSSRRLTHRPVCLKHEKRRMVQRGPALRCVHTKHSQTAGPFSVTRLKTDLPFQNRLVVTAQAPALLRYFSLKSTDASVF